MQVTCVRSLWHKKMLVAGRRAFPHLMELRLSAFHLGTRRIALPLPLGPKNRAKGRVGHKGHQTLYYVLGYSASAWRGRGKFLG